MGSAPKMRSGSYRLQYDGTSQMAHAKKDPVKKDRQRGNLGCEAALGATDN
jgi:hypothetical protein